MDELNYYDYSQILADTKVIIENQEIMLENQSVTLENQEELLEDREANEALLESNTVLVNFFFLFMVLMVCKFVHFLFYKVFFGGIT